MDNESYWTGGIAIEGSRRDALGTKDAPGVGMAGMESDIGFVAFLTTCGAGAPT